MNTLQIYNSIIVYLGVPTIIAGLILIGRKFQLLDTLVKDMDIVKHNMKVCCDFLTKNFSGFSPSEIKSHSPYQLTEDGKDFIVSIGFDKVFQEHKEDFFKSVEINSPKLKYDVELASIQSIYFLSEESYMEFLKIYFYNHPERNMQNAAPTLGVYIRDKYLTEHPEIIQ